MKTEEATSIRIPKKMLIEFEERKIHDKQPYYEVIEEALELSGNKTSGQAILKKKEVKQ